MRKDVVFVLCGLLVHVNSQEKCNGVHLLEDLGCQPVTKEGRECPIEYKCSDFTRKKDQCLFKSKVYGLNEEVNDDLVYPACEGGCFCREAGDKARFTCAVLDCPEWLGLPLGKGCHWNYEVGECCANDEVCPPFDEKKSCQVDGETYKIGQRFFPKNTCLGCVCKEGFNGNYTEEFCKKDVCATEINYLDELEENCAPVYYQKTFCCPSNWTCPESKDEIKIINSKADLGSDLRCKFGDKSVKLGEGLEKTVDHWGKLRNIQCQCQTPPFLTCHEI